MRKRTVRELGTVVIVIAILAGVALVNGAMRRGSLADQMDKVRRASEENQKKSGISLLSWELLRKTKGNTRSGPTFAPELLASRDKAVSVVGFMVPAYVFRNMTEFLLLPLPIQCYFCEAPPMRDVVLVQMDEGKGVDLVNEPVLINGALTLNEGPGTKFFYVIKNAERGVAERGGRLTPKNVSPEQIQHGVQMREQQEGKTVEENLLPAQEPPAPVTQ